MRLQFGLDGMQLTALVDIGSTHNFLDPRLAKHIRIPYTDGGKFLMKVANGETIGSQGQCSGVLLQFPHVQTPTDFLLKLAGCDMVLGIQWLCTVSPV